jgi:hypothetical protein
MIAGSLRQPAEHLFPGEHQGRGPVVDPGGIACRHRPLLLLEDRRQLAEFVERRLAPHVLVDGETRGLATPIGLDGDDLLDEASRGDGRRRSPLTLERRRVLARPIDVVAGRDVLGGHAHQSMTEGIGQRAIDHVDQSRIPELLAPAHRRRQERCATHDLDAAADRDIRVAEQDRLRGRDDRLESGAAQSVDRHRRCRMRDARLHGGDPRHISIARLGRDHLTENDMSHRGRLDPGAPHRFAGDARGQIGRCKILQRTPEAPDGRARSRQDVDIAHGRTPGFALAVIAGRRLSHGTSRWQNQGSRL